MASFSGEVWKKLSSIDVSDVVETKGTGSYQLKYLSWAWAWGVLMENYPDSEFHFEDDHAHEDGSVTTWCVVTIKDGDDSLMRLMWLPVMDHKNNAIKNPDARQISDTRMRCLVKCLSMFGLGHYIYAGEDLPREEIIKEPYTKEELDKFNKYLSGGTNMEFYAFCNSVKNKDANKYVAMYNSFESNKVANKKAVDEKFKAGQESFNCYVRNINEMGDAGDIDGCKELYAELSKLEVAIVGKEIHIGILKELERG